MPIIITILYTLICAPFSTNNLTNCKLPFSTACINNVDPDESLSFGSAPLFNNSDAFLSSPSFIALRISLDSSDAGLKPGLNPNAFVILIAPLFSNNSTIFVWPLSHAKCNAVLILKFVI